MVLETWESVEARGAYFAGMDGQERAFGTEFFQYFDPSADEVYLFDEVPGTGQSERPDALKVIVIDFWTLMHGKQKEAIDLATRWVAYGKEKYDGRTTTLLRPIAGRVQCLVTLASWESLEARRQWGANLDDQESAFMKEWTQSGYFDLTATEVSIFTKIP